MKVGPKVGSATPPRPTSASRRPHAPPAPPRAFAEVLREGRPAVPAAPPPQPAPAPTKPAAPNGAGVARVLASALAGEKRVDAILDAAARGKTFTAGEMLAMQATVFRYSQTVEILSRATDRLVGAVKQTLGTPI